MGKLVLHRDGNVIEVDSFTQRDINESRVWYQHMHKFKHASARDSFLFDVTAELTKPLLNQVGRQGAMHLIFSYMRPEYCIVQPFSVTQRRRYSVSRSWNGRYEKTEHPCYQQQKILVLGLNPGPPSRAASVLTTYF